MNKFNETVDLSNKIKDHRTNALKLGDRKKNLAKKKNKAEGIDRLYSQESTEKKNDNNLKNIDRPQESAGGASFNKVIFIIFLVVFLVVAYFIFFKNSEEKETAGFEEGSGWYTVKLIDNKVYYGQIDDKSTDPILIRNVYYDYDQLRQSEEETEEVKKETGSLRLVKRGKETHGPSGNMEVFREKILLMEELSDESKVLKAILEYEK